MPLTRVGLKIEVDASDVVGLLSVEWILYLGMLHFFIAFGGSLLDIAMAAQHDSLASRLQKPGPE